MPVIFYRIYVCLLAFILFLSVACSEKDKWEYDPDGDQDPDYKNLDGDSDDEAEALGEKDSEQGAEDGDANGDADRPPEEDLSKLGQIKEGWPEPVLHDPSYGKVNQVLVKDDKLYLATFDGMHILDISEAEKPVHLGSIKPNENAPYYNETKRLLLDGNHLYAIFTKFDADNGALMAMDVSKPQKPTISHTHKIEITTGYDQLGSSYVQTLTDIKLHDDKLWVNRMDSGIFIFDLDNPATPDVNTYLGFENFDWSEYGSNILNFNENILATAGNSGIATVDIENWPEIEVIGHIKKYGSNNIDFLRVGNTGIYVSSRVHIVNVRQAQFPKILFSIKEPRLPKAADVSDYRLYIAYGYEHSEYSPAGLAVYDISNWENPDEWALISDLTSDSGLLDVQVVGDYAYAGGYNGLYIYHCFKGEPETTD